MSSRWINLCFSGGLVYIFIGFLFASTPGLAFNGPHKLSTNECDVCHIPHHAADEMLWARTTTEPFGGVKRLCATCHGTGLYGAKDRFGIFESEGDVTNDHVMGLNASINGPSITRNDWELFPLKENEGGDGFYCGSCHDPHLDPYEPIDNSGGGDYLRQEAAELIKDAKDKEISFCTQCHNGIIFGDAFGHGNKEGCYDCHHPHASRNPGPKILISPLISFTAIPNCQGFSDLEETSAACYGCHREKSGFDGALGAPLAGDDLSAPREHHPMGKGANASTLGHQPTQAGPLTPSGELYCGSCHTVHNGTNDHYLNPQIVLRYDTTESAMFCIACHSNKKVEDLGPSGEGHHQVSPNNQCLFCHSIHNAPNDPDALFQTDEDEADQFNSSVSVDVIMRVPPENLAWSDKTLDTDTRDYEDACYGCHFQPDIVGKEFSLNEENSLLLDNVRDRFFSHRFNVIPSPAIKLINTFDDRLPIVSDGQETETINDYGVEEGRIWCGSCHNVHRQNRFSTEFHEDYKERRSAYLRAENYGSALCYRCHTGYHEDLGGRNHPQDEEALLTLLTSLEKPIPIRYYEGYSGGIGGLTNGETAFDTEEGEVVCQTCHSVHTAETDWNGGSKEDDLFDHGRLLVKALDEGFCQDCHQKVKIHPSITEKCIICHFPHQGIKPSVDPNNSFKASPNAIELDDIKDNVKDPNTIFSAFCYACHQPSHLKANNYWIERGAVPIFGDLVNGEYISEPNDRKNHHPMGSQAKLKNEKFLHAPGDEATNYLVNEKITCISCHADIHGVIEGKNYNESKKNNFLRWDFTNDDPFFCLKCHSDKSESDISGKHLVSAIKSPNKRGGCMFCHFIHDGEERKNEGIPGSIRADIDALMRVDPKNLAWGDKFNNKVKDRDPGDYEDMCFGCHGDQAIVGEQGSGSLLNPDEYFTHRFAVEPQLFIDPNMFPISDADGTDVPDDYGSSYGRIFCGTCHDVHKGTNKPYLRSNRSPYEPYGFCEACHDEEGQFVYKSHPIGVGPNPDPAQGAPTAATFVNTYNGGGPLFSQGGSGKPGGITYPYDPATGQSMQGGNGKVICLTCHNTHAAATSWEGKTKKDNSKDHGDLLVKDNMGKRGAKSPGSELCKACHPFGDTEYSFPEGDHGDRTLSDGEGICNACHTPHKATGPKLWSREGYDSGPFGGYRQLCYACHKPVDGIAETGLDTVFKEKAGIIDLTDPNLPMDHVMHAAANISNLSVTDFPVDPNDWDTFPPGPEEYREGGSFYCGSCHNPHVQPKDGVKINGKYLRASLENSGENFCRVCHQDAHASTCLKKCHKVHKGAVLPDKNETEARWILSKKVIRKRFVAYPNVPSLSEDPNDFSKTDSPFCYGCHGPVSSQYWEIPAIYGDDAVESGEESKEHHPMGTQAWLGDSLKVKNNVFIRAEGTPLEFLNPNQQVTCKSCHDEVHGKGEFEEYDDAKANYFLRWKLNDGQNKDKVNFCLKCHVNKETLRTNPENKNHYWTSAVQSPNKRGGCIFCHFIHDGEERQANHIQEVGIRADVDALMRELAVNLAWGDQSGDSDRYDYEDMCYGCHSKSSIVKGSCNDGALLKWSADLYTHRFASAPDPNNPPYQVISDGSDRPDGEKITFPKSDGNGTNILNDYGAKQDYVFCGTCHRVHDNTVSPYLNHEDGDSEISPYKPAGFCEYCHDADSEQFQFVHDSHPVSDFENDYNPNPPATVYKWPNLYFLGRSGCEGGITYPHSGEGDGSIICLTCHNVHAAATNWKGQVLTAPDTIGHGKLLVKDNFSTEEGSDMCKDCHKFDTE